MLAPAYPFAKDQVYLFLDFETYSEADLSKVGAYEYAVHPTTEVLCVSWSLATARNAPTDTVNSWWPDDTRGTLAEFMMGITTPNIILVAHNALFDRLILTHVFAKKYMYSMFEKIKAIPTERWLCTAALASSMALPRSLEKAVDALKLPMKKNMDGNRLIKKWCKPRTPTKYDDSTRHHNEDEFKRLVEYCEDDIRAMIGLFLAVNPLSPSERELWCLDQEINMRGILIDRPLIDTILKMIDVETTHLDREVEELTMGIVSSASEIKRLKRYLETEGVFLPGLDKLTVEQTLKEGMCDGVARRLLELRVASSKTSTAKYEAFEKRSRSDGRVRDTIVFHAATTGRDSGAGVQLQNLPRPSIKDTIQASKILARGDVELVRLIYGDVMLVFSDCIRNMIIATPGMVFDVADYASIEVRVAFWLAGDEPGLQAYRENRDLYIEQAASIFSKKLHEIAKDSFERFLGKEIILGCQYGLGAAKFQESCAKKNQDVPFELCDKGIKIYRRDHPKIVDAWGNLEAAAIGAIQHPGKQFAINRVIYCMVGDHLYCKLPSGRKLTYPFASVEFVVDKWKRKVPRIYYWTYDSTMHKWMKISIWGGTLLNHNTQGTARDIMMDATLRIEKTKTWRTVLKVHDEIVAERNLFNGNLSRFCKLMEVTPAWAEGCPIKVEGFTSDRYRK